jgi:hypothetical protein
MLRRVALVRTHVSEELSASFIRVTRIGELWTTLAVTSRKYHLVFLRRLRRLLVKASVFPSSPILVTLMKEALSSSETSVLTRATRRNIPEDTMFYCDSFIHLGSIQTKTEHFLMDTNYTHVINSFGDFPLYSDCSRWHSLTFRRKNDHARWSESVTYPKLLTGGITDTATYTQLQCPQIRT